MRIGSALLRLLPVMLLEAGCVCEGLGGDDGSVPERPDAASSDGGSADAGTSDGGSTDAGRSDAGHPDSGLMIPCTYHVSPAGDDGWTGRPAAPNAARTDGPLRTFGRARDVVRSQIAGGMTADLRVCFRGGDYFLLETVQFGPQDSGRDGHTVSYSAYPGEEPVFHGAIPLRAGWSPAGPSFPPGTWRIGLDAGLEIHTLYDGHRRARKARTPNLDADAGWNHVAALATGDAGPYRSFHYQVGDVPNLASLEGLQVVVWPNRDDEFINWEERTRDVSELDPTSRLITLERPVPGHLSIGRQARYALQGRPELLDAPGEFYYQASSGWLYYLPFAAGSPLGRDIYAPTLISLVSFRGSTRAPVRDIALEGLTLRHGGAEREERFSGAVELDTAQNVTLSACRLDQLGSCAVVARGSLSGIHLEHNLIHDVGSFGVLVNGRDDADVSHDGVIQDNAIFGAGQLVGHGAGIAINYSSRNRVAHNLIRDTRRWSIGLLAGGFDGGPSSSHTRDNIIEYNDVSYGNTDSEDTGLIYHWGYVWRTVIRNNRVHDSPQSFEASYGIYLDDWGYETTVENNVLCNLGNDGGYLRGVMKLNGVGHRFVNNVLKQNTVRTQAYWANNPPTFGALMLVNGLGPRSGQVVERNIFFRTGDIAYSALRFEANALASVNHNFFWGHQPVNFARLSDPSGGAAYSVSFDGWKQRGFDLNSQVVDPGFLEPEGCDVRLQANSPALAAGFVPFETGSIGLRPEFPFRCTGPAGSDCARK